MARRLLLVHAHPDDESINTGATMARYVAEGADVTLVTCTLGDEGEILLPEQSHRAAGAEDTLGVYRWDELQSAMAELGVNDIRLLGGWLDDIKARWRDSGMVGAASNDRDGAFIHADSNAVDALVDIILDTRPHVVVTYDSNGGYGHPDHIQAHRITHAAAAIAAGQGWRVSKVYACARVLEVEREDRARFLSDGGATEFRAGDDDFAWAVPKHAVTTVIDAQQWLPHKTRALSAHATQVQVAGQWYALSDGIAASLRGIEYFTCEVGIPVLDADGVEHDLFAGIAEDA
ncbi:MAG: N-acetyl-1-D-myo-inositol-2-amino-2-deoxy-alpha-D-glucopyranoside deacetylase [Actinobacteria bacterium]|nr:N-acetyl-1-D-myo-inositol-2-amino-2-deoxy-alpha-D-glucopyranoside deacetylase [Actinomycetota bacterium]